MAEIDLQRNRKRGGGWLPWVLGALVAILVIWAIASLAGRDEEPVATGEPGDEVVTPAPAAELGADEGAAAPEVAEFRQTCVDEATETPEVGPQHEYTVRCLDSMTRAMGAVVRSDTVGDVVLNERLEALRERADDVRESDAMAVSHSATVAEAFDAGAELLESVRDERDRQEIGGQVEDVREAADAVDPDQLLLEQEQDVREYFAAVADALERLGQGGTGTMERP